jgi:uncharacterized protein (TIGR00645 family)
MSFFKQVNNFFENATEYFVFASRWLQVPVYLGLIVGCGLYTYKFMEELATMARTLTEVNETRVMLSVLGLIDISMVLNLMIIVIIGGYSIFTSRIDFEGIEDKPQWLDHMDADKLKVKLSSSLASISGVHLLKTFIDIHSEMKENFRALHFEIGIHMVFIISALLLAWIVKILDYKSTGGIQKRSKTDLQKL